MKLTPIRVKLVNINHNRQRFTVSDPTGRVLFMTRASPNGLHYLKGIQPLDKGSGVGRKIFPHAELRGDNNVDELFNCVRPNQPTSLNLVSATPSLLSPSLVSSSERVSSIRVRTQGQRRDILREPQPI